MPMIGASILFEAKPKLEAFLLVEDPPGDGQEHGRAAQPGSPEKQLGRELALSLVHSSAAVRSLQQRAAGQLDPCDTGHQ